MNQIRINRVAPRQDQVYRIAVVCTLCSREVRRAGSDWDCGTPHRPGTAQMQYRRVRL